MATMTAQLTTITPLSLWEGPLLCSSKHIINLLVCSIAAVTWTCTHVHVVTPIGGIFAHHTVNKLHFMIPIYEYPIAGI